MASPQSSILIKDSDLESGEPHATKALQDTSIEKPTPVAAPVAAPGPAAVPPPPNGGTKAWMQVLGAFFLNFNTWGIINTYGVFQSYYSTALLASSSESAISWIGSIQAFLMLVVGVLCGRALDAGYYYSDIIAGTFLIVFGTMSKFFLIKHSLCWHWPLTI